MRSSSRKHPLFSRSGGFTLVELLITIGIIALLFGMSMVGIAITKKNAQKTRVKDDLQMIIMALEQYKSDFHDYPRFADPAADAASTNGQWLDYSTDRGARLLCQALIAPGPANGANGVLAGQDGADGPGFRIRRNAVAGGALGGRVYGPYLDATKFKLEYNPLLPNMQDAKILDIFGNPILYFPAMPGPPQVSVAYVSPSNPQSPSTPTPLYNAIDNAQDTTSGKYLLNRRPPYPPSDHLDHTHDMQILLGDTDYNGYIEPGESAVTTLPYLLWTAGSDGIFGRDAAGKTDDIANFDFAPGVRK